MGRPILPSPTNPICSLMRDRYHSGGRRSERSEVSVEPQAESALGVDELHPGALADAVDDQRLGGDRPVVPEVEMHVEGFAGGAGKALDEDSHCADVARADAAPGTDSPGRCFRLDRWRASLSHRCCKAAPLFFSLLTTQEVSRLTAPRLGAVPRILH